MPQHMDPAFLEPTPPAVEPKDTETGDLFAQTTEESNEPTPAIQEEE